MLLVAAEVVRVVSIARPIALLMALSGLVFLAQGWVVGSEGFSPTISNAIVLAEVLNLLWAVGLLVVASRMQASEHNRVDEGRRADEGVERPAAV